MKYFQPLLILACVLIVVYAAKGVHEQNRKCRKVCAPYSGWSSGNGCLCDTTQVYK